jgi:hypothetical protein
MIIAISARNNVVLQFSKGNINHRLERKYQADGLWFVLTDSGFVQDGPGIIPKPVEGSHYLDADVTEGIYQYRERNNDDPESKYEISYWVKCGVGEPVGYTFGNYKAPEGSWGEVLTADDLRYSYVWGTDLRASNGMSYTDDQIRFHINSCMEEMAIRLNITIRKKRIACQAEKRGLKEGEDYDEEEDYYQYRRERVQRTGWISTRKRPVISISKLDLLSRNSKMLSLLESSTLDKTKGVIKFFNRPLKLGDSMRAVQQAVYPYGEDQFNNQMFYSIDYVAGFENSDKVPADLRAAMGKMCAIEMLNIIGDGLMSGFSSSSLSMDGVSESFSSTQSATSAYYGARIQQYNKELADYIKANKLKFGHFVLGAL